MATQDPKATGMIATRGPVLPHAVNGVRITSTSIRHMCICTIFGMEKQVKDIKETYLQKVASYIEANFVTGDALRRQIRENVATEVAINSQRGMHHVRMSRHTKAGLQRSPLFAKDAKRL
ncbi:hypothetical protein VaNZ11_012386 [Volvox africanus]|uniref:Uncharacterized protein n=1 Tax=Volvox africanus TaxID=51714 RepID=A0ABQ5SF84_9CHLO|nr:hypothetical protein VaNZ11_012386 [Volvox africanus]